MAPLICCFFALAAGQNPSPKAADQLFLEAAQKAHEAKDTANTQRYLRAWATLSHQRDLPRGLEEPATAAVRFSKDKGLLQVFASRLPGLVRVGVHDPAGIVDHLEVFAEHVNGKKVTLVRVVTEESDRQAYRFEPQDPEQWTVVVEAYTRALGSRLRLRRATVLSAPEALPQVPDPKTMAEQIQGPPAPPLPEVKPLLKWWWVAAGVVAAGLVGVAAWQQSEPTW